MQLKKPDAISFSKSNTIHPFEDSNSLAFWSRKNDASLFLVGLHSKKRPNNLVLARTFDNDIMDMLELGIEHVKSLREYAATKFAPGQKPLFHFSGELFDTHPLYQQLRSVILDFFRGEEADKINLAGLEHVISCTVGGQEGDDLPNTLASTIPAQPTSITDVTSATTTSAAAAAAGAELLPLVHFRTYAVKLLASGSRTPLVNLESVGPDFDFRIRRTQQADGDVWKAATKKPKKAAAPGQVAGKKRKDRNIDIDEMGDKVGRIHVGKQDLGKLQARKMKGLDRRRDTLGQAGDEAEDGVLDEEVAQPGKRPRT